MAITAGRFSTLSHLEPPLNQFWLAKYFTCDNDSPMGNVLVGETQHFLIFTFWDTLLLGLSSLELWLFRPRALPLFRSCHWPVKPFFWLLKQLLVYLPVQDMTLSNDSAHRCTSSAVGWHLKRTFAEWQMARHITGQSHPDITMQHSTSYITSSVVTGKRHDAPCRWKVAKSLKFIQSHSNLRRRVWRK